MSIIFGVLKQPGAIVEQADLLRLGCDTKGLLQNEILVKTSGNLGMGFRRRDAHARSHLGTQPTSDECGNVITLDGRLDNYAELADLVGLPPQSSCDSEIALAAFRRWGKDCFARLVGDWSLALWCLGDRTLYLCRDHAGARTLYFEEQGDCIVWSTSLRMIVAMKASRALSIGYATAYLMSSPVFDRTPYHGIKAVTPAHYLKLRGGRLDSHPHWHWMARNQIIHKSDSDYDEHFRELFRKAVARRTALNEPTFAHLSGGVDSTSIVCMSDCIRRSEGCTNEGLINTLSFYDDSEPDWNERPFFSSVEAARGKKGTHIDVSLDEGSDIYQAGDSSGHLLPGSERSFAAREQRMASLCLGHDPVAIVSGIGGDELLGGVCTAFPELADVLFRGNIFRLADRAMSWSLASGRPLVQILFETLSQTAKLYLASDVAPKLTFPWIPPHISKRAHTRLQQSRALSLIESLEMSPSRLVNGFSWWLILETLPHRFHSPFTDFEYRYPFLDRDLVDFLLRVPRDQIVGPGRRRLLMRRALASVVPRDVLERRRKSFVSRRQLRILSAFRGFVASLGADTVIVREGLINLSNLRSAFDLTESTGNPKWAMPLIRAISLAAWLEDNSNRLSVGDTANIRPPRQPIALTSAESCRFTG